MLRGILRWLVAPVLFLLLARLVGEAPTDLMGTVLCIPVYKLSEFIAPKILARVPPKAW